MRSYDIGHRSIEAATGDRFRVTLEAMSSGGYLWKVAGVPAGLRLLEETVRPASTAIGAPTLYEFRLEVMGPIDGVLVFAYARPWDAGGQRPGFPLVSPSKPRR